MFSLKVTGTVDFAKIRASLLAKRDAIAREAAERLAEKIRQSAPAGQGHGGHPPIADTVHVEPMGDGRGYSVVIDSEIAVFVEYGHVTINGGFVPPNPFVRLAVADIAAEMPGIAQSAG